MQKGQILGLFLLLAVTAAVSFGARPWLTEQPDAPAEEAAYGESPANMPAAALEGEALSPNGRLEARTVGASENVVSGLRIPEALQIVDTRTGEVKWEDSGYLRQSVLWSPGNNLVALVYGGRTWEQVKVISTAWWTSWDFTLPDGGSIPEYTFLPEDWGEWLDAETLLVTVGRGGDAGEQHTYRCVVRAGEEETTGSAMEQTAETLPGEYDFDHDGELEEAVILTLGDPEAEGRAVWYELRIRNWSQEAALAHVGWTSLFALKLEGQDCLLRYRPWMGQGYASYDYQIFSLDEAGREVLLQENGVEFDTNFGLPHHGSFDPAAIAAFLEEVHGYLDESTLLLTTEHGNFRAGGSGADFREDMEFWDQFCPYDESKSLEENLRTYMEVLTAARSGQA